MSVFMPLTSVVPSEPRKLRPSTAFMAASREPTRSAIRWAEPSLTQMRPLPPGTVAAAGSVVTDGPVVVVLSAEAGEVVAAKEPAKTASVVTKAAPAPALRPSRVRI